MPRYQTTLSLDETLGCGCEIDREIEVEFWVTWGAPAQTYGPPEDCYPAEPDEVDRVRVMKVDDVEVDLATADRWAARVWKEGRDELLADARDRADTGPDPDDARDQRIDDELCERG
jgi:hypothetical protein